MSVADMIEVARTTKFVAGLPNSPGDVGGDPGRTPRSACSWASRLR